MPTNRIPVKTFAILLVIVIISVTYGCVRRTLTITTEPPNALVFLNDQEIGRSAVSRDFIWYGDYSVVIRREDYKTLKTHWEIKPPWYQRVPLDFFAEVMWPGHVHDTHEKHFVLEEQAWPTLEELVDRANQTRARAHDLRR